MRFLKYIFASFCLILFFSCQSKSPIVTSKNVAIQKGIYNSEPKKKPAVNQTRKRVEVIQEVEEIEIVAEEVNNELSSARFSTNEHINSIIQTAFNFEGVRYRGGGTTKEGMDCSGLVYTTFLAHDFKLPRSSYEMATVGQKLKKQDILPGDLVFFKFNGRSRINHVGLVTEVKDDEVFFIHASLKRGVIVSSLREPYYSKSFTQANRVLE